MPWAPYDSPGAMPGKQPEGGDMGGGGGVGSLEGWGFSRKAEIQKKNPGRLKTGEATSTGQ